MDEETIKKVITTTRRIAGALSVTGPFNIQFIAKNNEIKVIEVFFILVLFCSGGLVPKKKKKKKRMSVICEQIAN